MAVRDQKLTFSIEELVQILQIMYGLYNVHVFCGFVMIFLFILVYHFELAKLEYICL